MGHVGTRRKLSLSLTASFGALGIFVPGAGLLDFVVNPLVVRAFGRQQELKADQKAVEILRAMGQPAPRRTLATALQAIANHTPREKRRARGLAGHASHARRSAGRAHPAGGRRPKPAPGARAKPRPVAPRAKPPR